MSRITRSPASPAGGSPVYSPDDAPVYKGGTDGGVSPPPYCSVTISGAIVAPGSLGAAGFAPMSVSGLTATTQSQPSNESAEIQGIALPTGTNAVVMEVHYDPTSWNNGGSGSVYFGDLLAGAGAGVNPGLAGPQAESSIVLICAIVGGITYAYATNMDATTTYDQGDVGSLSSLLAQVYAGGKTTPPESAVTFVVDAGSMNITKAQLDTFFGGAGRNYYDICGNQIFI